MLSNEKLTTFRIDSINCFCCMNKSGLETINHIFNNGDLVDEIWKSFSNIERVKSDKSSLEQLIAQ